MPSQAIITRPGNPGKKKPTAKATINRPLLIVAVVVGAILFGAAGWGLHALTHQAKDVSVASVFTGTVTLVGNNGQSGCVQPDSGGRPVCTNFYVIVGSTLHAGDKVHAAREWAKEGSGSSTDLLLIYK